MTDSDKKSILTESSVSSARVKERSLIGLALVLIIVGAVLANLTFSELKRAAAYESWQKATATVVDCLDERDGVFSSSSGHDYQMVTCQFSTAGRIVRSHFRSDGWKYHKGQTVEMRFDPFAPQHSMAGPSTTGQMTLWGSIGFALFFISGTTLLIYSLKKLRKSSSTGPKD